MSSQNLTHRRRPRSDIEDEEDAEIVRSSQRSPPTTLGKRARTNGYRKSHHETNIYDDEDEDEDDDDDGDASNSADDGPSQFQPGAIIRVKLTNFVTYENAEFFPGPNLNMVIGPNGTGKSSLVCAICLGLGWGPAHLGRAGQVGEFVKHGMTDAFVEIELQHRPGETNNSTVRVRIIRDGNGREWWLDGRKTSLKAVQALTKSLSIQIDNLCQFLPQDKVSEFAALSPVELLLQTQRAAAPEQMLEWHDALKLRRKEQKSLEPQHEADKETFDNLENRQQNLQTEVQRLQERQQIQEKVRILRKQIPFVEYRHARTQHIKYKEIKRKASERLSSLLQRVEPLLASVNIKENYRDQITAVVKERENALKAVENEASRLTAKIDSVDELVTAKEDEAKSERTADGIRKKEAVKIQRTLADLRARLNEAPIEFDAGVWNEKIRNKEQEARAITSELRDLQIQNRDISARARINATEAAERKEALEDFNSQEGQQLNKIQIISTDTATAWKWVQENRELFEKEVYGPPMVSCSVKDLRYTDAVESLFQKVDFLAITAQTKDDWQKLSEQFFGIMKLSDVTIRSTTDALSDWSRPRISADEMQACGLDFIALDVVDGPEPVLSMLCDKIRLHLAAIGLHENSDSQHNRITQSGLINNWIVGRTMYRVSRRVEYGPMATSTTARTVHPAKYWSDRPVDTSKRREIEVRIAELAEQFQEMRAEIHPIREKITTLQEDEKTIQKEIESLKTRKGELQRALGQQQGLPAKIIREEEAFQDKQRGAAEHRERMKQLSAEHDKIILRKAQLALDHKDVVSKIRVAHEDLLEAEIRLIEAKSDIEALNERNGDITQRVAAERQRADNAEAESRRVKAIAAKALEVCKEIQSDPDNEPYLQQFADIVHGTTVESLETEIAAEESKLEFIHANNPNAIRDFERRQVDLDKLKEKMDGTEKRLEKLERYITKVRSSWEPELDKLIAEISEAFSHNFEQIGCAGAVSVHKDDDFELWAIQIKVKFRENETLQLLDQHRQSGGERSVSTIFYLMSLQSLARAPFRVVDEINQGMDPRNERMVHERMVEIACKEHTSQYFLITPKLLTGLRYDKRMKVLCIASGEHMPESYKNLDVSRIIGIQRAIMASS